MYRTLIVFAVLLGIVQSVQAQTTYKKDDVLYIVKDDTKLTYRGKTTVLKKGTEFTVIQVKSGRVGGKVMVGEEKILGYLPLSAVTRIKPKGLPDEPAPEVADEQDEEKIDALVKSKAKIVKDRSGRVVMVKIPQISTAGDALLVKNLGGAPHMEQLVIHAGAITDKGMAALSGLTKLRKVIITDCEITDKGLIHLKNIPNLAYLDLSFTNITDAGLKHLAGTQNLERVYLSHTKINGSGLAHLASNENLTTLSLTENKLQPRYYSNLALLKNLEKLSFSECWDINGSRLLSQVKNLKKLRSINIGLLQYKAHKSNSKQAEKLTKNIAKILRQGLKKSHPELEVVED